MSLNLLNSQISQELGLNKDDIQQMTQQLREAVHRKTSDITLDGEVECDEVYAVADIRDSQKQLKKAVVGGGTG
ncbi:hypothetical protein [uncultured Microbulbifer sp.]|uniref:hypothetical protein n=1 Tax=uncultured Microbulbifer sp. TaxID=348147 RepID=UPI002604F544|nr:hypothetical protein [uncultured Microbulbifer sp.]